MTSCPEGGKALLLRKWTEFSQTGMSSIIVSRPGPPLPSLTLKNNNNNNNKPCVIKNFKHAQRLREQCSETTHLSPRFGGYQDMPPSSHLSLAFLLLFLLLCWSISKQTPDILSFPLSQRQYAFHKSKTVLFSEPGAGAGAVERPFRRVSAFVESRVEFSSPGPGLGSHWPFLSAVQLMIFGQLELG